MAGDGRRGGISDTEAFKVYLRSGGRCVMCGKYLLEGTVTHRPMRLGELAHIVGAKQTPGSPRGMDPLPKSEREKAENLMLVCRDEHTELDRKGSLDVMTVEKLRAIKQDHEAWIFRMTGLDKGRGTAVLRMNRPRFPAASFSSRGGWLYAEEDRSRGQRAGAADGGRAPR